ncbi:MAG: hypothetical protein ACR2NM_00595, partial [Bythopirellula sp.]
RLINEEIRQKARQLFRDDIRNGNFVREWSDEQAAGSKRLEELKAQSLQHPLSQCEESVIAAVQATVSLPKDK